MKHKKQTYSKYTYTTCALNLLHVCFIFALSCKRDIIETWSLIIRRRPRLKTFSKWISIICKSHRFAQTYHIARTRLAHSIVTSAEKLCQKSTLIFGLLKTSNVEI